VAKQVAGRRHYPKVEPLLAETRGLLRHFDLKARKGLGQHFLIDREVLGLITSAAELTPADVIMEIGPGLGVLTTELARQAGWVVAIELDSKLADILEQTLAPFDNVTIVNEDILQVEPAALLREQKTGFPPAINNPFNYKVVANLPYYITAHVLRHFLEASVKPQIIVVMVQKEVAEAIVAESGRMSLLSISVQFYGKPRIISNRVDVYPQPAVAVTNEDSFFGVVRAGFTASRKQIGNSLAQGLGLSKPEVASLLGRASIVPQRRAETLTLDEWAQLWQVFTQFGESHADCSGAS